MSLTIDYRKIGRPKVPDRDPVQPHKKSKRCRGCGELGHNLKACDKVNLDLLYSNLTRPRARGNALAAVELDSSSSSSGAAEEQGEIPSSDNDDSPRKRSASHALVVITQTARSTGGARVTRGGK